VTSASRGRIPPRLVSQPGGDGLRATARAFELVCRHGPLSRSALRSALGVGLSTVTAAVQELVEYGYVVEAGQAASTGGRRPQLLDVAPGLGGVLAVDIGGSNLRFGAADLRGALSYTETCSTSEAVSSRSLREVVLGRLDVARKELAGPVRAVGVAIAGIVDPDSRRVSRVDHVPGWVDGDDLDWLEPLCSRILVDNEANLGALGERRAVGDDASDHMLFVALGAGVGGGLILGGSLYRGATGAAGEIGMLRRGHEPDELERVASTNALVAAYRQRTGGSELTSEQVVARAAAGEPAAQEALTVALEELAVGIANAVIVLNPEVVVLGGGLARADERVLEPLRARISALVPAPPAIRMGSLGTEAALVGAAGWAVDVVVSDFVSELQRRVVVVA
jgi:predicted NBD/HSP70 family sugar kinase